MKYTQTITKCRIYKYEICSAKGQTLPKTDRKKIDKKIETIYKAEVILPVKI